MATLEQKFWDFFECRKGNMFELIESAIAILATENTDEFLKWRPHLVDVLLFSPPTSSIPFIPLLDAKNVQELDNQNEPFVLAEQNEMEFRESDKVLIDFFNKEKPIVWVEPFPEVGQNFSETEEEDEDDTEETEPMITTTRQNVDETDTNLDNEDKPLTCVRFDLNYDDNSVTTGESFSPGLDSKDTIVADQSETKEPCMVVRRFDMPSQISNWTMTLECDNDEVDSLQTRFSAIKRKMKDLYQPKRKLMKFP